MTEKKVNFPNSFYEASVTMIPKPGKDQLKKKKKKRVLQKSITHEYHELLININAKQKMKYQQKDHIKKIINH